MPSGGAPGDLFAGVWDNPVAPGGLEEGLEKFVSGFAILAHLGKAFKNDWLKAFGNSDIVFMRWLDFVCFLSF